MYYGRTWDELREFFNILDEYIPEQKIIYVHNLSFEFQYLSGVFKFKDVFARTSHKVMNALMQDYNILFKCTYFMSNLSLENVANTYNLKVKKLSGNLDYSKIRHPMTSLSKKELSYCEYDCLVVYYYILEELKAYKELAKIPGTQTGKVRRELRNINYKDFKMRVRCGDAINTDGHIFNLLNQAYFGGYTHGSYTFTGDVLKSVDSWDFTSSYPYVLTTYKFPGSTFKKCYIKSVRDMLSSNAYLLVVKFKNLKTKYHNTFLSSSSCRHLRGAIYDNGRVLKANECEITLTDVDFKLLIKAYNCEYEIIESYYAPYKFLPKNLIMFILEKYVFKTKYKGVAEKEVEYNLEKAKFNSIYGMMCTNTIRDTVTYDNDKGWVTEKLTNEDILELLKKDKKNSFLSYSWGVWTTAHARNNLLQNVMKLDEWTAYCDTDSLKLIKGYDKKVIDDYNSSVERRIKSVSKVLNIPIEYYKPKDDRGLERMLGVFDFDGHYEEFVHQGAKRYCVTKYKSRSKLSNIDKVIEEVDENLVKVMNITCSGVPKKGVHAMNDIRDFKDNFVFDNKYTGDNILFYCDDMSEFDLTDYQGVKYHVKDKKGCCLLPNTYTLGKSLDYLELINNRSSERSVFNE